MSEDVVRLIGTVAMLVSAAAFIVFLGLYLTMSNWRATPIGRYIAAFIALIATVFIYLVVVTFTMPDLTVYTRLVIRLGVFGTFAIFGWWLIGILVRIQIRERRRR